MFKFFQKNSSYFPGNLIGMFIVICLSGGIMTSTAYSTDNNNGQIVLYLELPEINKDEVILSIDSIIVKADDYSKSFIPIQKNVSSLKNSGKQIRLVDSYLNSGIYNSIIIYYNNISGYIGKALVSTGIPEFGQLLQIDFLINTNQGTLLNLHWDAQQIQPKDTIYIPQLSFSQTPTNDLGSTILVANEGSDNISVIDHQSHRITKIITTGKQPKGMAYSQKDRLLFVCNSGSDNISVIDILTQEVLSQISLQFGDQPTRTVLSTDENLLYVLNIGSNSLSVIDIQSYQEEFRINISEDPISLTISNSTGYVYISNSLSNEISIYDPVSRTIISSVTASSSLQEIIYNNSLDHLYSTGAFRPLLIQYNMLSGEYKDNFNLCSIVSGLELNSFGDKLYIAQKNCREISVFHVETSQEINRILLDETPGLITLENDNRLLNVIYPNSNQLAIINVNSSKIIDKINVGTKPYMAIVPW